MSSDNCNVFYGVLIAMVIVAIAFLIATRPAPKLSLIQYERIYTCHIRYSEDVSALIACIEGKP